MWPQKVPKRHLTNRKKPKTKMGLRTSLCASQILTAAETKSAYLDMRFDLL